MSHVQRCETVYCSASPSPNRYDDDTNNIAQYRTVFHHVTHSYLRASFFFHSSQYIQKSSLDVRSELQSNIKSLT